MRFCPSLRWMLPAAASLTLLAPLAVANAEPLFQVSVDFPPPPSGQGGPSRTAGGGVRAGELCAVQGGDATPSVILAPANNVITTADAEPTFHIYVPEINAVSAELVIFDDRSERYKLMELSPELREALADGPTLLEVKAENADLEPGQRYEWNLSLLCDVSDLSNAVVLAGDVELVEIPSSVETALAAADSPLAAANIYAQARIWSEAVALTLSVRDEKPSEWQQLLRSAIDPSDDKDVENVDLDDLFAAPVETLTVELEGR